MIASFTMCDAISVADDLSGLMLNDIYLVKILLRGLLFAIIYSLRVFATVI